MRHIKLFEQYTQKVSENIDLSDFEKELYSLDKDEKKYYIGYIVREEGVDAYSLVHDCIFEGFTDIESALEYIKSLIKKGIDKNDIDILTAEKYKEIEKIREQGN